MTIGLDDIRSAAAALAGDLTVTPTIPSPRLSEQTGCRIHLKLECLHHTGSFKERGALNKLKSLSAAEAAQGVIAMSAGNHAQGVAYHATRLGIPATIVMPAQTPFTKVERTESYGAKGSRVEATEDLAPVLEAAFKGGGVHVVTVPIDYSENMRVLVDELKNRVPPAASA